MAERTNRLMNRNGRSKFNSLGQTYHVPVGQPDATVADGMSYGIRSSCAMHADSFFVERDPENANRATRTGRQHVKMAFSRRNETSATWLFP